MRQLILALAAIASMGAISATAEAMPAVGSASVAPAAQANGAIQKTTVVVVKKPVRRKVCKTVMTGNRRVTKCVTR